MGQADFHEFRAQAFQLADRVPYGFRDAAWLPEVKYSAGMPTFKPFMSFPSAASKSGTGLVCGGGVLGVVPGDGLEQDGGVFHRLSHGADLVQGGGKGHQTVAGDAPVGGLEAYDAAVTGGLPDGAARIGSQRGNGRSRRYRRSRAAGRAAGDVVRSVRVAGDAVGGVFPAGAHGEFTMFVRPRGMPPAFFRRRTEVASYGAV